MLLEVSALLLLKGNGLPSNTLLLPFECLETLLYTELLSAEIYFGYSFKVPYSGASE